MPWRSGLEPGGYHWAVRRALAVLTLASWLVSACGGAITPAGTTSTPASPAGVTLTATSLDTPAPPQVSTATLGAVTDEVKPTATLEGANSTGAAPVGVTPSPTKALTATPSPWDGLMIDSLSKRSYGSGELKIEDTLAENSYFTRYLVSYLSDDLTIYGFMNVPARGQGPYPVIIAVHGYIDPANYNTLDYTTEYADALTRAGYIVIHPNLRGYPPSDEGDNLFRVGMAVDVLSLIAAVKAQAGKPGPLEQADGGALGLWGHSMGGGIVLRVITVSKDVKAAVLYAPMSGDELQNYTAISEWSGGTEGQDELEVPEDVIAKISPVNYLNRITAEVNVHHGESDQTVPPEWSADLCWRLLQLGKPFECFTYPGQNHTFSGPSAQLFLDRVIEFYDRVLR